MKRNLLLALTIGILLASCGEEDKKETTYDIWGLNCPVKSIKVTTYEAKNKFGELTKNGIAEENNYFVAFNTAGKAESVSTFGKEGDLVAMEKYKYDSNGNLTEVSSYGHDGELLCQQLYEYEGTHEVRNINKYLWDDDVDTYEHTSEWDGEKMVSLTITHNGELESVTKYTKRDKSGNEWVEYDKNGDETGRGSTILDEAGFIKQIKYGEYCGEVERNEKSLPVHTKNARIMRNTMYSFGSAHENEVYYAEYEYDERGNWIKQTIYEGEMKKPVTISEREINY